MSQPGGTRLGRLAGLVACLAASGCATTWLISESVSGRPPLDESARQESVPLPGVSESLHVALYLEGAPVDAPAQPATLPPAPGLTPAPAVNPPPPEPVLDCTVSQHGRERAYRAATRYGHTWKVATGVAFLIEGGLGALLLASHKKASYLVEGGFLALDGLGSGLLFFAPRRGIYETSEHDTSVTVRRDCPDGLLLDVDGQPLPVDAAGHLTELGVALLEHHLATSDQAIGVRIGAYGGSVSFDVDARCEFARGRSLPEAATLCRAAGVYRGPHASASDLDIDVPLGTLTAAAPDAPAPDAPAPAPVAPAVTAAVVTTPP